MSYGPLLLAPVVSTQWLADHLGADDFVVLDASVVPFTTPEGSNGYLSGHEQYIVNGHVPGAVFADLIENFSDPEGPYPFTRPSASQFAAAAGALGVSNDTTVVVYDSGVGQWASRVWWLFRAFGYDTVAVLDGGLVKWRAEERELETGHVEPTPAAFAATERPELWVEKSFLDDVVSGTQEAALVCGLPPAEFAGTAGGRARRGHIPGSVSAPAARLVDRASNALLAEPHLREIFAPVLGHNRVVTYCAGGIAAASDALVLTLLGHNNVAIYDASLNEWANDAEAPLASA